MSAATKYQAVHDEILQRLYNGQYAIGMRLPTEGELSQSFDVSRVTIRKALDMLVQDGYVESKQGSGYTVLTLSPPSDTCLTSFTDAMLRAGKEPTSRFRSLDRFTAGAPELAHLPVEMQDIPITRIVRLRMVDGQPSMLVMTYAPSDLLPDAAAADFPETGPEQSILRILQARFQLEWSAACEDISPVLADADLAETFRISLGHPLLKQACSAFDDAGRMVFHEDVFRNGPVSFNLSQSARKPRYS